MTTGTLYRRFSETQPTAYDKNTRIVCLDIKADTRKDEDGNDITGYSYLSVEIDSLIDYGHIKSQLIEAAFAQKDEFGLLMNAVENIISAVNQSDSWAQFKNSLNTEDIQKFIDFCQFREICADAAKTVIETYY